MGDQLVAEAATYTTHNKHKRQIYMPSKEFEPATKASERPQTNASDRSATTILLYIAKTVPFSSLIDRCQISLEITIDPTQSKG